MGADGGVQLKRKDLVSHAQKTSKEDQHHAAEYNRHGRWQTCFLSQKPLEVPLVSDYKGQLYNKESILELLVDPEQLSEKQRELVPHIKSLKDVVELQMTMRDGEFVCPITDNVLGSNGFKYAYLVRCGCVFAEKCLKEIASKDDSTTACPLCSKPYDLQDVIIINPNNSDLQLLQARMKKLSAKSISHSLIAKKPKKHHKADKSGEKKKKRKTEDTDDTTTHKKKQAS